jgi:hypothetical protein
MNLFDYLQNLQSPVRAYQEKFGNLPEGLFKLCVDLGTVSAFEQAMTAAVASGVPMTNWDVFRTWLLHSSEPQS